jgi:hypothetical protein
MFMKNLEYANMGQSACSSPAKSVANLDVAFNQRHIILFLSKQLLKMIRVFITAEDIAIILLYFRNAYSGTT